MNRIIRSFNISALSLISAAAVALTASCGILFPKADPPSEPSSSASPATAAPEGSAESEDAPEITSEAFTEAPGAYQLHLSELVPGQHGWAELVNTGNESIDVSAYSLTDDPETPHKWTFPSMELAPGALIVAELNEDDPSSPLSASFKIGKSENAVYVFNNRGENVDSLEFEIPVPEGVSVIPAEGGVVYTSHITKGEPNSDSVFTSLEWVQLDPSSPAVRLYINEVLPSNKYSVIDSYGDRSDWVELLNPTDDPVDLGEFYLSDDPEDLLKWRLPETELPSKGYALIFLSGKESVEGEIHAPFSLSNGESICLSTLDGMITDIIGIPDDMSSNISIGRDSANELRYYTAPTPRKSNSTHALDHYVDSGPFDPGSLYISEVSAVAPARSGSRDWVELHNGSSSSIPLTGWALTDDIDEPDKYVFEGGSVSAGGYAVLTCSSDASKGSGRAPFSISNSGDTLYLIDPNGFVRDVFSTGVTNVGITSGRANGSEDGARCFFSSATKGSKNASALTGICAEPVFSVNSLYCSSSFPLEISCATPGAEIRYTTDGSGPTSSSKLYSGPIQISSSTVIKAVAYRDGYARSPVGVKTYLFHKEHTLPVVSISLSSSDYSRMYVASQNEKGAITKGDEVSCYMEYYVDGRLAISTGAGVRVSGASTALYAQKGLGLYFRSGYGRSSVDYPFFKGCDVTSFRSLTLRNGGQDAPHARMRDSYMSRVCQGLNIDVAYVQPVIVYINGQYRGIYDLKDNLNEDYLVSHYGINRNRAEIIARNGKVLSGDRALWYDVRHMCQQLDFSKKDNYERLLKYVDADCVIDYLIARTYFYDGDMFNQKYWHSTDNKIKWRPVFFDSDYAMMGNSAGGNILPLYFKKEGFTTFHGSVINMDIFCALNQNKEWRDKFITRYIYVVKNVFGTSRALSKFDSLVNEYKPEIRGQIEKWHMPSSYDSWQKEVSSFRACVEKRPSYALKNLRSFYGLSEAQFHEYEKAAENLGH